MSSNKIYIDGSYANEHPQYHVEDSPWKAQQVLNILNKNRLIVQSVCEVGCGAGEILR